MSARSLGGLAVLLAIAVATWYLASTLKKPAPVADTGNRVQQGFYLRNARILGTGDNGELLYEIRAEYAKQLAEDRISFENVRIRYTPEADVPWSLSADEAIIVGNQGRMTLFGHVLATSNRGNDEEVTEVRTEWLELEPEKYLAHTDRRVQIRVGERSITATGMEARLREDRLQLKSNVSGKFVP